MKLRTIFNIVAAFCVFIGFGMIHASTVWVEKTGSILIGIGSLYLIVTLIYSMNSQKQ